MRTLDQSYIEARQRFLDAAHQAGARLSSWPHPDTGLEEETLALDVAQLGDPDATKVLMFISATHGVEGYAGSALQSWWLDERFSVDLPEDLRIVIVHALNPVGFSWVRRVNEDNVDLNRNFIDWSHPPRNDDYATVADLLVPESWSAETQESTSTALLELAAEKGFDWLQQAVSGGQYDHPTGVFYGGSGPTWANRWISAELPKLVGDASAVAIVDLHTGLGEWGHGELISHELPDDPGYQRGAAWWGDVRSMQAGESVSADLSGSWQASLGDLFPGLELTAVSLEFGTVDPITVLQSLRADAWLHAHGDPTGADAPAVRAQVRAAFADDDPAWLATLIERFDRVSSQAVVGLVG